MTEEVKQEEVKKEEEVVQEEVKAVELSEAEQQAYKEGWRPETEFDGDKSRWIPADEFMRRKPLFEKIESLKSDSYQTRKELQEVKKTLTTLADHHKKVRETEYDRALADLKTQRRVALEERDGSAIDVIEEKIDGLKQEKQEFDQQIKQEVKAQVAPTPEYVDWVKENSWYHTDREMHDFADGVGASYLQGHPTANPNDVFSYVTKQAKRAFPEKFGTESRSRPSRVDSGTVSEGRASPKTDDLKLSPDEEEVARRFEKSGIMTRKEYAAELKKVSKR